MSGAWDPFQTPEQLAIAEKRAAHQQHLDFLALTRAVFGAGAGAKWLELMLADERRRPSYRPGDSFDQVAWREGRKALLQDIQTILGKQEPALE